jgi:choice-of-anchor B domain-containing protein
MLAVVTFLLLPSVLLSALPSAIPPEVQNLQLQGVGVFWDEVPGATVYRAFRGSLSGLPNFCAAGSEYTATSFFFDVETPPLGEGFGYLAAAVVAGEEGSLGLTSSGAERASLVQCDSDADGVVDDADNCPYDLNSEQDDADLDGTGDACDFAAARVVLRSRVPLQVFPDSVPFSFPDGQSSANDVWHYVSPGGEEYALVGLRKGAAFVRVTDPRAAALVGYVPSGSSAFAHDMAVFGQHAYLVTDDVGTGLQIVDLADIDANRVSLVNTTALQEGFTSAHNVSVNESSGHLYLARPNLNNGLGITAVDLNADPVEPTIVGTWTDRDSDIRCQDIHVVTYADGPFSGREIAFCFAEAEGLRIVDVTDKRSIRRLSSLQHPEWRYTHQGWLSADGTRLFVNDERDEIDGTVATTPTYVVNVEDLNAPFVEGTFTSGLAATDHNLMVRDDLVFEANYRSGLRVFNACNPSDIHEIAFFDSDPLEDLPGVAGAWGVTAALPGGTVLLSDIERGLFVLDASAATVDVARRCTVGGAVDPTCDACVDLVCSSTPECCQTSWDDGCVEQVRTVCASLVCGESAGSCAHVLCDEGGALSPGCDAPPALESCVQAICDVLPSCCAQAWDEGCVQAVSSVCGAGCD